MAKSTSELHVAIVKIFKDVMDVEDIEITNETTADDVEEWDSLSHVRLIVAVEKKYAIKFSDAEIESLRKFGDLVTAVARKTNA
ncbi:acyl carrier protein [uncultured Rhodospira sp.]|uniref:acyl carrier protein n=1 Tax=uncultured Rhodospira sp. TaxID=1936189 RepID=UPI002606CCDD|nr:acyl carrier protein [uncultured Rhodospira sp.]